jgi:hypothetical protein
MKATWDKKTGRVTFEDGRFIVLTGDDINDFDVEWCLIKTAEEREEMLKKLIRSKHSIHYPPKNG